MVISIPIFYYFFSVQCGTRDTFVKVNYLNKKNQMEWKVIMHPNNQSLLTKSEERELWEFQTIQIDPIPDS